MGWQISHFNSLTIYCSLYTTSSYENFLWPNVSSTKFSFRGVTSSSLDAMKILVIAVSCKSIFLFEIDFLLMRSIVKKKYIQVPYTTNLCTMIYPVYQPDPNWLFKFNLRGCLYPPETSNKGLIIQLNKWLGFIIVML